MYSNVESSRPTFGSSQYDCYQPFVAFNKLDAALANKNIWLLLVQKKNMEKYCPHNKRDLILFLARFWQEYR